MKDDGADLRGMAAVTAFALAVYVAGMSPVVFWGDSAEFSIKAATLELTPIARGYPLHRALCHLAGAVAGDPAVGANLVSAVFAAITLGLLYEVGRLLGGCATAGLAAAATCGLAHTFWSYAEVAEVYSLHTAFLVGALLLVLRSLRDPVRAPFWLGLLLGVSLLHHRMIFFALPGMALWLALGVPPGSRAAAFRRAVTGGIVGAVPFIVLCVARSRTPPPEVTDPVLWWVRDVFMGGDDNAQFILGAGRKTVVASAVYLGRFLVFNLPGPALVLAGAGILRLVGRGDRAGAIALPLLLATHLVFPFRYDWTGDQYAFLIPVYPLAGAAVAVGVGWLGDRWGRRAAWVAAGLVAAVPAMLYLGIGMTKLRTRAMPGLTPQASRDFFVPVRTGERTSEEWCRSRLEKVAPGAVLHADWGDGQVYRYLQEVEDVRRDVTVSIWYGRIRPLEPRAREQWVSVLPFTGRLPKAAVEWADRLEERSPDLFRIRGFPEAPR